jgi:hypothetical protein
MNDLKTINSDYPMTNLECPKVIFHDASNEEKKAIARIRNQLAQQLFHLSASDDLNVILEYVNKYPNTTFTLTAEEEYNDEGYDTRVRASYNCDDENEEAAIEKTDDHYYFAEKLTSHVIEKINGARVDKSSVGALAKRLLGQDLGEMWMLGKIGLEKEHFEKVINDPKTQVEPYKL